MEPSGVGGMGEQFEERCTGSVPSMGVRPSYLSLMASVAPQYGLVQQSSFASWYSHDCFIDQRPHVLPSVDSVEEQQFPPNCSRSYKEMTFPCLGKESAAVENQPMKHVQQQTTCGYSSTKNDRHEIMSEDMLVADEDFHHQYYGNKPDTVSVNQPIKHFQRDVAVGYSSAEDGLCKSITRWGRTSPLANNEQIMGAVEQAMRNSSDRPKEHMFLPKKGVVFPSLGDAYQFYNLYSWEVGSIRKNKHQGTTKNSDGTTLLNMQEYTCQRARKPSSGTKFSTTMCGCPARLRLLRNENNEYYVSIFVAEHNHELVESCGEKRYLNSHQSIDQATKDMIRILRENNVPLSTVNSILGSRAGSMDNLGFNKKRLKTVCSEIAVDLIADDIQKTMSSFMKMRDEDPNFVYALQMDKDCRITSLMWSSGYSRRMYSHFGDVVTFDTTYKTNIYNMPFGMFVGVNNHFQSVIYAGVLLTSETTESFAWAFKTFVEMMGGKAPVTMLTDQAAAMGAALRQVLKETKQSLVQVACP